MREGLTSNNEGDCKRYHTIMFVILIFITIVIAGIGLYFIRVLSIENYANSNNITIIGMTK